jgi:hypothetical protein
MWGRSKHISDRTIVSQLSGELRPQDEAVISAHLATCTQCRTRRDQLDSVMHEVHQDSDGQDKTAALSQEEARKRLRARLSHHSAADEQETSKSERPLHKGHRIGFALAAACASVALGLFIGRTMEETVRKPDLMWSMPDSRLTPGATVVLNREAVCSAANVKNKRVPVVLERKVLDEYGIRRAAPQTYEVDYLVTPALGGADDIRNLWPQSFSADWNALVKDQLEDHLRDMVCNGELDLTEAQREIARNWIGAYKKYFHTDRPLAQR